MAPLRALLLAGLCAAASAVDAASLMQRELGLHAAGAPPAKVLERLEPTAHGEMLRAMGALTSRVVRFLELAELPLSNLLGEPRRRYEAWGPEQMAEFAEAFVVACNESEFPALLERTSVKVANQCWELGTRMGSLGVQLAEKAATVYRRAECRDVVLLSLQQSGAAMAHAGGRVFNALSVLLQGMPTPYLRRVARRFQAVADNRTSARLADFNARSLQPGINSSFQGEPCRPLKAAVASFGALAAWRNETAASVLLLNASASSLEPYLAQIDAALVARVMGQTRGLLARLGASLDLMGSGFETYHAALAKAMEEKLRCRDGQ